MGENAVALKCRNNSHPETDRMENIQKFTVIPHNVDYKRILLQKEWSQIGFFVILWGNTNRSASPHSDLVNAVRSVRGL